MELGMATISASVGQGGVNRAPDVRTVQHLLNEYFRASMVPENGFCGPETITAIINVQKKFMSNPDGRVDPNGRTLKELQEANTDRGGPYFPFPKLPAHSWMIPPLSFGSNRSNGTRAHAGCDLYFPQGSWIYAITAGKVAKGPYPFYCHTYALEIDHGSFLARYGEIQFPALVKTGDSVKAGQKIAKVGHLVGISVPSDMLHLELYNKSTGGELTVQSAANSKKRADGVPFFRRLDLIDPTSLLNQWKTNLPTPN
jgi:murein DD-endopeptidase MepM/ murein hydrolase activator NlpD